MYSVQYVHENTYILDPPPERLRGPFTVETIRELWNDGRLEAGTRCFPNGNFAAREWRPVEEILGDEVAVDVDEPAAIARAGEGGANRITGRGGYKGLGAFLIVLGFGCLVIAWSYSRTAHHAINSAPSAGTAANGDDHSLVVVLRQGGRSEAPDAVETMSRPTGSQGGLSVSRSRRIKWFTWGGASLIVSGFLCRSVKPGRTAVEVPHLW